MQQTEPSPIITERSGDTSLLKVLAYPAAIGAGLWTAKVNIADAVYDRLKYDGGFDDLRNPLLAKRKEFTKQTVGELKSQGVGPSEHQFVTRSRQADNAYFKQIEGRLAELGLDSIEEQWRFIHRSQKQAAVINGLTITGITIGALLTMAGSKAVSQLFDASLATPESPQR